MGVILALSGVGAAIAALTTTGGPTFVVVGFVMAAILLACGFVSYRLAVPAKLRGVKLSADPETVRRGSTVTATIEHGAETPLEVGLVGARVATGTVADVNNGGTMPWEYREVLHEDWQQIPAASPAEVSFVVPEELTPSFVTDGRRTAWAIVARRGSGLFRARASLVIEVLK